MKIERNKRTGGYWTVVEKDGKYYYFDLSHVYAVGAECMGFLSDSEGNVEDWGEVYMSRPEAVDEDTLRGCIEEFMSLDGVSTGI